mmetsp:Transcript_48117/g.76058  ORF Transcript_48117/g.76058 Transcript_48117/m.76058 type:complete len:130 (-) Transcript_48117:463-852(-)
MIHRCSSAAERHKSRFVAPHTLPKRGIHRIESRIALSVFASKVVTNFRLRVRIESRKELSIPIFANWAATSVQVAKHSLTILVGCEFGKSCPCRSLVQVIQTCHCPVMQIETYIGITKSSWDPEGRGRK